MTQVQELNSHFREFVKPVSFRSDYMNTFTPKNESDGTITSSALNFSMNNYPLFRIKIGDKNVTLREPLTINVRQEGEWCFAVNDKVGVVGTGTSFEEAVLDLKSHIVFLWNHYKKSAPGQLTEDAIQEKRFYDNLLLAEL